MNTPILSYQFKYLENYSISQNTKVKRQTEQK